MANENMIKFLRGNVANLPQNATAGALYFTKDEGIYMGMEDGSYHRYGDFITVANVEALPASGAHETCMYYCTAENILARYDAEKGWIQINKQPTADEMKVLLGLGSIAYKSEVAEGDLNSDLAAKINAASGAQHTHTFVESELNKIADGDVAKWNAAEGNAKTYADGLNTAMNTRVEALEAIDHEHANKALLDTYTQTEANLADAVAKKHAHTFVESELNKIVAGDVAKWNGVVADHLTSADKTAIEDSIGDVNTALENYKTSNNEALAGVKATAEAAAVKTEVETALAGKVDKVEGKSLIADSEIARLATLANYDDTQVKADIAKKADAETVTTELGKKVDKVDGKDLIATSEIERLATLHNYDDTQVKADIAKKADSEAMTTELGKKVDKVTGYSLVSDTEIARLADVDNYDDAEVRGLISDNADAIAEIAGDYVKAADIANFETKENVKKVADDLADYAESNDAAVADRYTKSEADGKFAIKGEDAYDDEEVRGLISDNADAIAAEAERAAGIEDGLRTDVDDIKADYLKAADKIALQDQITANATAINVITNGIDAEKIDGLNDLIEWADEHAPEVKSIKEGIEANAKAISDEAARADEAEKALAGRLDTLEAIDHDAYKAADTALHTVISKEIDDDVAAAIAAEVTRSDAKAKELADAAQAAAEAKAAELDAALKTELQGEIDADVAVVNDALEAYKTSNDAVVATKANSADVYTKTETYTQAEVDALLSAATSWGEF